MITVFNGRSRQLGRGGTDEIYIQVTVGLREHLHLFGGADLKVFMAIALHANKDGWAHPSAKLLMAETGLQKSTIFVALNNLCALEIDGARVLLRDSGKGRKNSSGTHVTNRYLIFPSPAEVAEHETPAPELPFESAPDAAAETDPMSENQVTAMSENQVTAMSENQVTAMSENQVTEVEPDLTRTRSKENQVELEPP